MVRNKFQLATIILLTMAMRFIAPTSVSADLLGYWSADSTGGQGSTLINDLGDSALDGELFEVQYTSAGEGHTGAPQDYALEFPGEDFDYVVIPPTDETFEEATFTAWVKGIPTGAWTGMISTRGGQALYLGFQATTTDLAYVWNDNSRDTWGWVSDVSIAEEEWTFVALTITEDAGTVYAGIPGEGLDSNSNEIDHVPQDNFNEWRLGEDDCCGTERNFAGLMDDVSIWNEALTEEQLNSLFLGTQNPLSLAGLGPGPGGAPVLLAGDADEDLDFDQLDLVRVQIAGKYLTGAPATWGDGDWDGAPGGQQGSPPSGDGEFNQLDIIGALAAGVYLTGPYAAIQKGGVAGDGQTSITYNPKTGELGVDAPAGTDLTSVNIDSAAGSFTGDPAQNLGGSFDNDSDNNIFKATFGSSFGSLSFGLVAQTGLSEDFVANDLTVVGSLAGGGDLGAVDLIYVPEPSTLAMLVFGMLLGLRYFGIVIIEGQQ